MAINYAQAVALFYPNYVLTKLGSTHGDIYEDIEWSSFNPTGPISKSTLDALIADNANNFTAAPSLHHTEMLELSALGSINDSAGIIRKVADNIYTLDTSIYLTSQTLSSTDVTNALGYFPYDQTNPQQFTTKNYVDSLAMSNTIWLEPVHAFNFVGTASSPPITQNANENYIISVGGNVGAWSSFNVGDRVSFVNGAWELREVSHIGDRLGICFDKTTTGIGDALGKDDYIGEIVGGDAINGWVWEWTAPVNNDAVFNNLSTSVKFGQAYTYVSSSNSWIPFSSNAGVDAGNGLSFSANVLNINTGAGIQIDGSNHVVINTYPTGGIITSLDGITSSLDANAKLSLATVGTPGTYRSVSVDLYGRVTAGTNPTTLDGYGITSVDWSYLTSTPNTLAGYGIIASINNLSDVLITSPTAGQYLSYNGTSWVNTTVNFNGVTSISAIQPSAGLTISGSPITSTGTLTFNLDNDLAALESLNGIGFYTRIASDTWAARSINGSANISITNGDGINGNPTINLSAIGTAGTYKSVSVDSYGRVTTGTNPTTLAGFGITDAAPVNASYLVVSTNPNLTNERTLAGTTNQINLTDNGSNNSLVISIANNPVLPGTASVLIPSGTTAQRPANSAGLFRYNTTSNTLEYGTPTAWVTLGTSGGSVTSVSLVTPPEFTVSGNPITTSGTFTITKNNQAAHAVYVGPVSGSAQPTFRPISLANGDLDDAIITSPVAGQTLYYDGTNWVNWGSSGTNGGGAAKRIWSANVASSSGTSTIIPSATPPLITAGTQIWTITLTPFSTAATYLIQSSQAVAASLNNANLTLALFRTVAGVSTYIGGTLQIVSSGTNSSTLTFSVTDIPNTTQPVTYSVRVGTTSGTWYVNQRANEVTYGGLKTGWAVWEY